MAKHHHNTGGGGGGGKNVTIAGRNNSHHNYHHDSIPNTNFYDHDKISVSSLSVLDDLNKVSISSSHHHAAAAPLLHHQSMSAPSPAQLQQQQQHRTHSMYVRNWAQQSDVPYIIGANITEDNHGICGQILFALSWILVVIFFPFSLLTTIKVVQEYERAVIFRLGRLLKGGAKGPGLFIVLPCIESYSKVDMRTVSFDVPPQEVLTKDSVTVAVDAVVYYRVFNPVISIANVENSQESTRLLAQTSLRNVLGTNSLAEILSNREAVSACMREILDEATDKWGIKVERVEIKDVRLPIQLQRAMAAEAEATREARAKVIAAEGEHKASRALKDAADILNESSSAIQLRYLQTLNNIAAEKNSTIVFPIPIEFPQAISSFGMSSMLQSKRGSRCNRGKMDRGQNIESKSNSPSPTPDNTPDDHQQNNNNNNRSSIASVVPPATYKKSMKGVKLPNSNNNTDL